MKKIISLLFACLFVSFAYGQSLLGKWTSLQPIGKLPAYIILQIEEKDSVGLCLYLQIEQDGGKVHVKININGTYHKEHNKLTLNFIDSTLKGNCEIEIPDEAKSEITDEIALKLEELKSNLIKRFEGELRNVLPVLKAMSIKEFNEKELIFDASGFDLKFKRFDGQPL